MIMVLSRKKCRVGVATGLAALRKPDTPDSCNRFGFDEATQPQSRQNPTRRIPYHHSTLLYFSHDRSNPVYRLDPPAVPLFDRADRVGHRTHKGKIRRVRLLLPVYPWLFR